MFLVKPYTFAVVPCLATVVGPCTTAPADPGVAGGGSTFANAGETFKATITAQAYGSSGNTATPSFGLGSANATETVSLSQTLMAPTLLSGGNSGIFSGTGASSNLFRSQFSAGAFTAADLNWNEVGVIQLTASETSFLGAATGVSGSSANIGRFYPDHFGVSGSVLSRSDVQAVEAQATPFTYMGEPMLLQLSVKAYGVGENITLNYFGAYARLNTAGIADADWFTVGSSQRMGIGALGSGVPLTSRLTLVKKSPSYAGNANIADPSGSWSGGIGSFQVHITVARLATGPDGPYDSLLIGAAPRDTDNVTLLPGTAGDLSAEHMLELDVSGTGAGKDRHLIASTGARYGRLRLSNAFGSEMLPLAVPAQVQYYDGASWVTNTLDSGSTSPWSLTPAGPAALDGATHSGSTTLSLAPTVDSGIATVAASAPGSGNFGYKDMTAVVPDYLKYPWNGGSTMLSPSARISFGLYQGSNRIIYRRERY